MNCECLAEHDEVIAAGVDPGFSEGGGGGGGGGANGNAWRMAVAAGRVPLKLLPYVLMFVAKFIFLWHLHLFIAARFLLACVFRELVILMRYE